jgi:hypothetical protein
VGPGRYHPRKTRVWNLFSDWFQHDSKLDFLHYHGSALLRVRLDTGVSPAVRYPVEESVVAYVPVLFADGMTNDPFVRRPKELN